MHGSIRACRGGPGGVGCMRVLISAIALAIVCACAGTARGETLTFGKTRIGATKQVFSANRKRVNRYSLPVTGTVSQLSIYLEPVGVAGLQSLQGVLYADSAGVPGALLASSAVRRFSSSEAAGWYALSFATPIELSAGSYWIGVLTGETGKVAGYATTAWPARACTTATSSRPGRATPLAAKTSPTASRCRCTPRIRTWAALRFP